MIILFIYNFFLQEFYGGKKELTKIKSDAESFICSVMPGSSSRQIKTTPGINIYVYLKVLKQMELLIFIQKIKLSFFTYIFLKFELLLNIIYKI